MAIQLTRKQVARLSDQELDAYARVVLDESRSRRAKLSRARNYHGRQIIPTVILLVATAGSWLYPMIGWQVIVAFLASAALLQWHTAGLNRRIDSLLDLLALETKMDRDDSGYSPTETSNRDQVNAPDVEGPRN